MKMKQIAGLCVLIPALLSGCGNQSSTQPAAASTSQPQATTQAAAGDTKANNAERPAMNQAQRQLFSTFQTLVMMDKESGLAITKEQATAMLPVAQDIVSKSELSDENKTKLLEKLTDTQKKFIEDSATKMANRGGFGGGNGNREARPSNAPSASPGAAGAGTDAGANAGAGAATGSGSGKTDGAAPGGRNGDAGGNRPAGGSGPGGGGQMKDPGKQLVELLQERAK